MLCLCGPDRLHGSQEKNRMTMYGKMTYSSRFFASLRMTAMLGILSMVAGCAKVNVEGRTGDDGSVPVTFSTYGLQRLGTKADASYVAPGADFAAGSVVGVYGYYHDNSTFATDPDNIADFMYHTALTKQSDGTWTYSPIKYWPNEYGAEASSTDIDRLSFWGYYPRNAAGLNLYKPGTTTAYDNDTPGIPKATFTQKEDPDEMIDLMFSEPLYDLYKTQAHTENATTYNYGAITDGQVTLKFRHALSLVEFQLTEGTGAKLNNLTLTKIKKSGTVEDCSAVPLVWTGVSGSFDIHLENITVDGSTILSILAIPQDIDADATFTLNYDITFASSDPSHPDPIVYKGDSFSVKLFDNTNADPAKRYGVTAWEAGKHYIYKISAGLDRIEFEEIVEYSDDWTVGNNNISVPE